MAACYRLTIMSC